MGFKRAPQLRLTRNRHPSEPYAPRAAERPAHRMTTSATLEGSRRAAAARADDPRQTASADRAPQSTAHFERQHNHKPCHPRSCDLATMRLTLSAALLAVAVDGFASKRLPSLRQAVRVQDANAVT